MTKVSTENIEAMEIISRFGGAIYDGQTIYAEAIEKAMDWAGVPKKERWLLAQKIIAYFSSMRHKASEDLEKKSKPRKKR
jgi:hypothetical protein